MINDLKKFMKSSTVGRFLYGPVGYVYKRFYKNRQRKQAMQKHAYGILKYILNIAEKEGVDVIPIYGTMLGFIREKDFIKYDYDIDLAVASNTSAKEWARLLVEKYGFKFDQGLAFEGTVYEFSAIYNTLRIDFFFFKEHHGKLRSATFEWHKEESYTDPRQNSVYFIDYPNISNFDLVDIHGISVKIPTNAEEWMYLSYGKNWRIPDPNWTVEDGCPGYISENRYGYSFTYNDLLNDSIPC